MAFWWVSGALAGNDPACDPRPPEARHVWAMTDDGRDEVGEAPGSAAGGAWFDREFGRRVLILPRDRQATFDVTDVVFTDVWTIESTIHLQATEGRRLMTLAGRGTTLEVDAGPGPKWTIRTETEKAEGTLDKETADFTTWRVVSDRSTTPDVASSCLWVDSVNLGCVASPAAGVFDLRIGSAEDDAPETLYLDDLAVHAVALHGESWPQRPRCSASTEPRPTYTELVRDRFSLDGNYLVIGGITWEGPPAVRHRLVLAPTVELSRYTSVHAQIRTLETRWIDASGSAWKGSGTGAQALNDVGVIVDLAWLSRYLRNPRFIPLQFAGGRRPRTFGLGIAHQNSVGSLDPTPVSPTWIYDRDVPRRPFGEPLHLEETDAGMLGSAMDGIQMTFGPIGRVDRLGSGGITLLVGRRRPLCAGRLSTVCEEDDPVVLVYEVALVSDLGHRRDQPAPATLKGVGGGAWVGLDVSLQLPLWDAPSFGAVMSAQVQTPIDTPLGVRLSAEGQVRTGLDEVDVAPEFRGSLAGGVADLDVVLRPLPAGEIILYGGAGTAQSGWNDHGSAAFHPDFDVDLVGFGQIVAAASAAEAGPTVVPSWGGLYRGSYVRYGLSLRYRLSGTWQLPIRVVHGRLDEAVGDLEPGWLGPELDAALLVAVSAWRIGVVSGTLWPNLGTVTVEEGADQGPWWLVGGKLGRDF